MLVIVTSKSGCPAQELLSHCLALHKDSQRKIVELEGRLRQYGYKAAYSGPVIEDPLGLSDSQPGTADAHANVACCMTEVRFCPMQLSCACTQRP